MIPDLILLDIMMPGMDGYEVCRDYAATMYWPKSIVMITALSDRKAWIKGIEAGADDFVFKPVDTVELRTRVQNITRLNRYRRLIVERVKVDWVLDQADEGYLMLDEAGKIVYANPRARLYLDLPLDNLGTGVFSFVNEARRTYH